MNLIKEILRILKN